MSNKVREVIPIYSGKIRFKNEINWIFVFSFLIKTEHANLLFDTGFNQRISYGTSSIIPNLEKFLEIDFERENCVDKQIIKYGLKPRDIDIVICSHLHFDHCGGLEFFSETSRIIVQENEVKFAMRTKTPFDYVKKDFECVTNFEMISGDKDLFGDGSIKLIYTPGHSVGHQSIFLNTHDKRKIMLIGDAVNDIKQLESRQNTRFPASRVLELKSIDRINEIVSENAHGDIDIFTGHDIRCLNRNSLVHL